MDVAGLSYLIEHGGECPFDAIPARLFGGTIPHGHPDLVDLGMVENDGAIVRITDLGRAAIAKTGGAA
jgi:hypothetical protein